MASSQDVFSRMRPSTMVAIIADLDDMNPEDYTGDDMRILHEAVETLIALVGVHDAIEMLSDAEVCAENPVIDVAFDAAREAQS